MILAGMDYPYPNTFGVDRIVGRVYMGFNQRVDVDTETVELLK